MAKVPAIERMVDDPKQWEADLYAFMRASQGSRKGVIIDYIYEPGRTVPQRLYRYEVYPDYVMRVRDQFEFGYELVTGARMIEPRRTYGVYVIEINGNSNHVYVGQSWYLPEERLQQHLTGYAVFHAAKPFKRRGTTGRLRPDLYAHLPRYGSQAQAEAMESRWAMELRRAGYRVEGGH
ncbi:MAG: hypothetical protein K0S68_463 [Candidatus Saccharibacteria bacterium]|jgi:hypothetical protein|nr:hypothetical protein [Candidatus Saccharibacteria bacterium]